MSQEKMDSQDERGKSGEIVVITGAAGCLGHHILRLLVQRDDRVSEIRCLDLRSPGDLEQKIVSEEIEESKRNGRAKLIKWIKGDVRDINIVEQILENADCVIHCAAKIDVWLETSEQNGRELESINVHGTELLVKTSIRLGVAKFIHVSSYEAYTSYDTIYYATESTLPETSSFLFGPSGQTKRRAEDVVKRYASNKLELIRIPKDCQSSSSDSSDHQQQYVDSLNAIVIRFSTVYGEFDRHYVSRIIALTKFLGGTLRRLHNVWIRQQPIYAGNAAWGIIRAKQRMDKDPKISGEEFHLTDDTKIGDPFDFVEPFLESKGMRVSKTSYSGLFAILLVSLFFSLRKLCRRLDFLGLFTNSTSRLQETIRKDKLKERSNLSSSSELSSDEATNSDHYQCNSSSARWYDYVTPQALIYMCSSSFLNRTKASLRLDYEPLFGPDESMRRSLDWYKNHLKI